MDHALHTSNFVKVNGVRLHYLDWGGHGPALIFLTGLGNNAYIYDHFAPRFTDQFHAVGLTRRGHGDSDYPETGYDVETLTEDLRQFMNALQIDQAILVGHSMANVELCHFSALYPERVLKLVFLDAAYDRSSSAFKTMIGKSPLKDIPAPDADEEYETPEALIAALKKYYPFWAGIWGEVLDEEALHNLTRSPAGKIVEKQSGTLLQAFRTTLASYTPEDAQIQAPVLSFYAILDSADALADYMTAEQKALVAEFFETIRPPLTRACIQQFRQNVPQAQIIEIPKGHHYCFIKQEELVFEEMRKFLLS